MRGASPADGTGWQEMAGSSAKFSRKQEEAIAGAPDAAERRRSGARRWCRSQNVTSMAEGAGVQRCLSEARRAGFSQSVARLQQAISAAATTLLKADGGPDYTGGVRLQGRRSRIQARGRRPSSLKISKRASRSWNAPRRTPTMAALMARQRMRQMTTLEPGSRRLRSAGRQQCLRVMELCRSMWDIDKKRFRKRWRTTRYPMLQFAVAQFEADDLEAKQFARETNDQRRSRDAWNDSKPNSHRPTKNRCSRSRSSS